MSEQHVPGPYDYVAYDIEATAAQKDFKAEVISLEKKLKELVEPMLVTAVPDRLGDRGSQKEELKKNYDDAVKHLEYFYMKVVKCVRDAQILRDGTAPLQKGRTDS